MAPATRPGRPGFLWSYWYFSKLAGAQTTAGAVDTKIAELFPGPRPPLFLDSGAYTAWQKQVTIPVRDYGDFLESHGRCFDHYANLDVKGDVRAGLSNYRHLRGRGLSPLPVFHGGEPWEVFEAMCEEADYVALGGIAGGAMRITSKPVLTWLTRCFSIAAKHNTQLHGFGVSSWRVLKAFPWASADSTSWHSGFRYGEVHLFDHYRGRWVRLRLEDEAAWRAQGWLVREHGFIPDGRGAVRDKAGRRQLTMLLASCWAEAQQWLHRHGAPNCQLYLVDTNTQHQRWAHEGINEWTQPNTPPSARRSAPAPQ